MTQEEKDFVVAQATAEYAGDEIGFDSDPVVSEGEDGYWVAGWVWVQK